MLTYAEIVTNYYLYGQATTPIDLLNPDLIRPTSQTSIYNIDVNSYMNAATGAGRFALAPQFTLINDFFSSAASSLPPGTYTKQQLAAIFGIPTFYGFNMQEYNYQDGTDDYANRTYIYNSEAYKIADTAQFVVAADGTHSITGFAIVPNYPKNPDNFDFSSDNWLAKIGNPILQQDIDPSGIGRSVIFNFTGNSTTTTYTAAQYNADLSTMSTWSGFNPISLYSGIQGIDSQLWNDGITNIVDGNKLVFYANSSGGTLDGGLRLLNFTTGDTSLIFNILSQYKNYGVALVGGAGNDTLIGTTHDDLFIGSKGNDSITGGGGTDTVDFSYYPDAFDVTSGTDTNGAYTEIKDSADGIDTKAYTIANFKFKDSTVNIAPSLTLALSGMDNSITLGVGASISDTVADLSTDNITFDTADGHNITLDARAYSSLPSYTNTGAQTVMLTVSGTQQLVSYTFNTSTDADSVSFGTGLSITLSGITNNIISAVAAGTSALQTAADYLTDLGDTLTTSALDALNYAYLNPTGSAYTVGGTVSGGTDTFTLTSGAGAAPGAVVAGVAGKTNILRLETHADLAQDAITGVQAANAAIGHVTLDISDTAANDNNCAPCLRRAA